MRPSPDDPRLSHPSRRQGAYLEPRSAMRRVILASAISSSAGRRPAVSASWSPWRRRGATTRKRTTTRASSEPPTVRLIQPQVRNLVRVVGQPSFIEAYERTSIFPKLAGYIQEWKVNIGDKVKKDQVLATLFIPELVEEHGTKGATVVLDRERIALAKKVVEVATADVKAAKARVEEAQAEVARYKAEVERWDSEVKRLAARGRPWAWSTPRSCSSRPISSRRAPRRGTRPRRPC